MNVPKLRFPEFSGEWVEKKLKECVDIFDSQRKPLDAKERSNRSGKYPYYGASGIIDYIDDYIFEGEAVLLGEDGANIINRNSRLAFIATGKYWVNNHVHIMKANSDNENYYICEYLENLNYSKICAGSAQPKLTQDVIRNLTIRTPCKQEQQKIADFLSNVDSIISAETKILNTLQKKKKALMQKLFTQQIRFKSNDGTDFPEWEEKKLGECVISISSGKNRQKDSAGNYPVYGSMGIIRYSEQYVYNKDCILVARVGANAGTLHIAKGKYDVSDNTLIIELNENELLSFYYYLLVNINLNKLNYGTGQPLVTSGMLKNIDIQIPCKAEQQKIADCLSSMDSLIQKQQKVVTTWQQRKKALLQQMFI